MQCRPVAGNADSPTATNTPKYALKGTGDGDGNTATAGYVKGAYNAVIKGINNTQDEINTLNTGITTYRNAIGHLTDGKATQSGTVATIKSARTNESIATSSVNFTGVTTTSISATASGNVDLSIPVMADWENDAEATNPLQTTTSFSGLAVNNLSMSAPTSNTATLTKNGINGNVDVVKYVTQAINARTFDFTTLIDVGGDDFGLIMNDGSARYNDDKYGLTKNGEWAVEWNDYGTLRGTAQCSSRSASYSWDDETEKYVLQPDGTTSTLPDAEGEFCWCKMTGFTDTDGNETPAASLWVFNGTNSSASGCAGNCAYACGSVVSYNSAMKSALFGSVQ